MRACREWDMIQCDDCDRIFYSEYGDVCQGICGVFVSAECGGVEGGVCGDELDDFGLKSVYV